MKKLPRDLKPTKVLKALERAGFIIDHTTGSHYILKKGSLRATVPYNKTIKTGTMKSILNQVQMTVDEFIDLL